MTKHNNVHAPGQTEQDKVLRIFFEEGRLKTLPIKLKKRLYVLNFLARRFEAGHEYTEKEVNANILPVYEDFCTIRRELVNHGFMERDSNGYRRLRGDNWMPEL